MWCGSGAFVVRLWFNCPTFLFKIRHLSGAFLVRFWCGSGAVVVQPDIKQSLNFSPAYAQSPLVRSERFQPSKELVPGKESEGRNHQGVALSIRQPKRVGNPDGAFATLLAHRDLSMAATRSRRVTSPPVISTIFRMVRREGLLRPRTTLLICCLLTPTCLAKSAWVRPWLSKNFEIGCMGQTVLYPSRQRKPFKSDLTYSEVRGTVGFVTRKGEAK